MADGYADEIVTPVNTKWWNWFAASAAHVVWVVGAQKIVPNLDEAFKRVREYSLALEDERALNAYGMNSSLNKWLIVQREVMPGRTTMILVKENLGF